MCVEDVACTWLEESRGTERARSLSVVRERPSSTAACKGGARGDCEQGRYQKGSTRDGTSHDEGHNDVLAKWRSTGRPSERRWG